MLYVNSILQNTINITFFTHTWPMGSKDWVTIKIPVFMAQAIDEFLKSNYAKKNGYFSRSDVVIRKVSEFLNHWESVRTFEEKAARVLPHKELHPSELEDSYKPPEHMTKEETDEFINRLKKDRKSITKG